MSLITFFQIHLNPVVHGRYYKVFTRQRLHGTPNTAERPDPERDYAQLLRETVLSQSGCLV